MGSSNQIDIKTRMVYHKLSIKIIWLWNKEDWNGLKNTLEDVVWKENLAGDNTIQAETIIDFINKMQHQFIPYEIYKISHRAKLGSTRTTELA